MADQPDSPVVRFELEHADGSVWRLRGEEAKKHVDVLNRLVALGCIHTDERGEEPPWEFTRAGPGAALRILEDLGAATTDRDLYDVQERARAFLAATSPCGCSESYPQLVPGRVTHGPGCRSSGPGSEEGARQAERIFDVLLLKEAMLAATEADLRAAHEGDLHILKRRCSICGEDFYTPHAEHDICRKHAYVGPRTALSGRADATKGGTP